MKVLKKTFRVVFYSNLAVIGALILLPALMITGDLETVREFIEFLNKE